MQREQNFDRSNGNWQELKAKPHNSLDDLLLISLDVLRNRLYGEIKNSQKEKIDNATKQINQVQTIFNGMADYDKKQDDC
jgi:hypothetical protein